jgi:hypothetical protein
MLYAVWIFRPERVSLFKMFSLTALSVLSNWWGFSLHLKQYCVLTIIILLLKLMNNLLISFTQLSGDSSQSWQRLSTRSSWFPFHCSHCSLLRTSLRMVSYMRGVSREPITSLKNVWRFFEVFLPLDLLCDCLALGEAQRSSVEPCGHTWWSASLGLQQVWHGGRGKKGGSPLGPPVGGAFQSGESGLARLGVLDWRDYVT